MRFLVDAQLPRRVSKFLNERGHDSLHTLDLPKGDATSDAVINRVCMAEKRVLITKDHEFFDTYLIEQEPYKLLLISTGNIQNEELLVLIATNISAIVKSLRTNQVVELDRENLTIHM